MDIALKTEAELHLEEIRLRIKKYEIRIERLKRESAEIEKQMEVNRSQPS